MKVLKFGGTSVGTVESLACVRQIVADRLATEPAEPLIVTVSALGGITDRLIATARLAVAGNPAYLTELGAIISRHHSVAAGTITDPGELAEVNERIDHLLGELSDIYRGLSLIRDLSPRSLDIIVSYGERLSSTIIAHILPGAHLMDSRRFIRTVDQFGRHVLDTAATREAVRAAFTPALLAPGSVVLVPGFIATASDDPAKVTNLGRGGSDYTAAILAAELNASCLEIWTDVDGFLTADPRIVEGTRVIPALSFVEAMELCNYGAKVIYPPTIYPVFHKNIPILIKNTFNAAAPGTLIGDSRASGNGVSGISSVNDTCLVTVSGRAMGGMAGISARILNALTRNGVSVYMSSQAPDGAMMSLAVRGADSARATEALANEFAAELQTGELHPVAVEQGLATIAIVGEEMRSRGAVIDSLFAALRDAGIDIKACAQTASETTFSFVTDLAEERRALGIVHKALFLTD